VFQVQENTGVDAVGEFRFKNMPRKYDDFTEIVCSDDVSTGANTKPIFGRRVVNYFSLGKKNSDF